MIFATHQTYNQYLCKGKVRAQELIFTSHQTYYQLVVLQRKSKGNDFCYPSNLLPVVLQRKKKKSSRNDFCYPSNLLPVVVQIPSLRLFFWNSFSIKTRNPIWCFLSELYYLWSSLLTITCRNQKWKFFLTGSIFGKWCDF